MRRIILGIAVPVLLASAACGADDVDQDATAEVTAPSVAEECGYDEKSLLPAMEKAVPADATSTMSMRVAGGGADVEVTAAMAYRPGGAEIDLEMREGAKRSSLVLVDDRIFFRRPPEPYQEIDGSDPAADAFRREAASMTVTSSFDSFRAGLERVETVGEEQIDGETVCHYTLDVDAEAAMRAQGEKVSPGIPATIQYELFLNEDDLIRRVTFDIGPVSAEMDVTSWNEPVDIEVPAGF